MKLASIGTLCLMLVIAMGCGAGVLAKHIPTTAAMGERIKAEVSGFRGELETFWAKYQIDEDHPENMALWNTIVNSNESMKELQRLGEEVDVIVQYHDITGGSDESSSNFDKWIKALHEKWVSTAKELENKYIKLKHGDLNEAQSLEQSEL